MMPLDCLPAARVTDALLLLKVLQHIDRAGGPPMRFLEDTASYFPATDLEMAGLIELKFDGYVCGTWRMIDRAELVRHQRQGARR